VINAAERPRASLGGGRPYGMRVIHGGRLLIESREGSEGVEGVAPSAVDDVTLARRVQDGDLAAFEPLYRRHVGAIYATCLRLAGDAQSAAELVQDVFVGAWEHIGSFRGESAFGTWLHRLAVNVVLQEFRATRRRLARVTPAGTLSEMTAAANSPATDVRLDLETALATLPPGARTVFVLHDIEGYSHLEIAALTGLAAGTMRAQLWRARQLMMEALSQ
jgi:RNA polymerase sigma-70 factor, ECF subfamily